MKIVLLLAYSIAIFWVDTWPGMAILAVMALAVWAAARLNVAKVCRLLVPVLVLAAFTVVFNAIPAGVDGLARGLFFGLRMVLLVVASFMVCLTTTSSDLVDAFRSLISPLRRLRVPVDDIALLLSLSVRFIPVIVEEFGNVHDAQRMRGARFSTGSIVVRMRAWAGVFVPLFAGMFRRADALAQAMDARCYGAAVPTRLVESRFSAASAGVLAGGLVLLVALAVAL